MPTVVLHQWEMSPFCNKVRRCLKHKGVRYDVVDYNGLLARKAAGLSQAGKLPVLDWDGQRIQDSSEIARFLDRQVPERPLYPDEPQARAAALLWEDWAGQSLYFYEIYFRMLDAASMEKALDLICTGRPRWERSVLKAVFKRRYPKKLKAQGLAAYPREEVERRFLTQMEGLDTLLDGRNYLAGITLSIGDIAVAAQLDELIRTSDSMLPKVLGFRRIREWLERCGPST